MPDWLNILLFIIIILGIIVSLGVGIYMIYKKINKVGICKFTAFTPTSISDTPTSYTQAGYISCSSGGILWKPTTLTVLNKGPGIFYIGQQGSLIEIDVGQSQNIPYGQLAPNIFYDNSSTYTIPNFLITSG